MTAVLWLLAGFVGGVAHFVLLHRNTFLYVSSGALLTAIGLQVLRLAAIGLLLGFAAWDGALPLLLAALGVMLARPVALRTMQVAP
jgi:CHASE2 domain-containing sensor protein